MLSLASRTRVLLTRVVLLLTSSAPVLPVHATQVSAAARAAPGSSSRSLALNDPAVLAKTVKPPHLHRKPRNILRVCNAYPYAKPMNIFLNEVELYGGMEYKECDDFVDLNLVPGDLLRFNTEVDHHQHTAGIFEISDLPEETSGGIGKDEVSTLLLVITRNHFAGSNAATFESHVFKSGEKGAAQVAVLDCYRAPHPESSALPAHPFPVEIMREQGRHGVEALPYGKVNKINPGVFDLRLQLSEIAPQEESSEATHQDSRAADTKAFVALPGHDYVVLRVGVRDPAEEDDGPQEDTAAGAENPVPGDVSFPEELVVFPLSDANRLKHSREYKYFLDTKMFLLLCLVAFICFLVFRPDPKRGGESLFSAATAAAQTSVQVGAAGLLTKVAGEHANSPQHISR